MKTMKRKIPLVMAVVLCLTMLAGCGGGVPTDSQHAAKVVLSKDTIHYLSDDGRAAYKVVCSGSSSENMDISITVAQKMTESLGVTVESGDDSQDGTDAYEILIGSTNRPESRQAIEYLYQKKMGRYADYIICTIGRKIVINGMSDEAVANAATYFVGNFIQQDSIKNGIVYTKATPGDFKDITVNGVGIQYFHLIRDNTNRSWLVQEEIRKVQEYIRETTGYEVGLEEDLKTTETAYEIHIGNTNRTKKPSSGYDSETWEIAVSGKNVYIAGGSTYAIQVAVTEFGKLLQKGKITEADAKTGTYAETVATYDSSTYYTLKWGDEFDGTALDETKWIIRDSKNGNVNLVKNDETFEMRDGNLIMKAIKREDGGYDHCDAIKSDTTMRFNKGYLEMRARVPDGKGVYSSFWCNSSGGLELDIFESLGMARTQRANIHYWKPTHSSLDGVVSGMDRQYVLKGGTLFDQYRTIAMYWDDNVVKFIYDGEVYYEQEATEYFAEQFAYIITGFNVGWQGRTPPAEALQFPLEYHIDYIRLFQVDGQQIHKAAGGAW